MSSKKPGRRWRPEFDEQARFATRPDLKLLHSEAVTYPPLARQTRISGTVVLQVSLGKDGTVSHVEILWGHPLLRASIQPSVRQWRFVAQPDEMFELQCEFGLMQAANPSARQIVTVPELLHLLVLASPPIIETNSTK